MDGIRVPTYGYGIAHASLDRISSVNVAWLLDFVPHRCDGVVGLRVAAQHRDGDIWWRRVAQPGDVLDTCLSIGTRAYSCRARANRARRECRHPAPHIGSVHHVVDVIGGCWARRTLVSRMLPSTRGGTVSIRARSWPIRAHANGWRYRTSNAPKSIT